LADSENYLASSGDAFKVRGTVNFVVRCDCVAPTATPSALPTVTPTPAPTFVPTSSPTPLPGNPTQPPVPAPTSVPTASPFARPTIAPSPAPSSAPTAWDCCTHTKFSSHLDEGGMPWDTISEYDKVVCDDVAAKYPLGATCQLMS